MTCCSLINFSMLRFKKKRKKHNHAVKCLIFMKYIYIFFTMFRVSNMINQFTEGLNSCGKMWDLIKANWIDFLPMFTKTGERISRPSFQALFKISWSEQGTKSREEEEEIIYHWKKVLKMIEGEGHFIAISLMFFHVTYSIAEPEEMT